MLILHGAVGPNSPNLPADIISVHGRLMDIAKIPCYECAGAFDQYIREGILAVQRHFMARPDGVIDVNGMTARFLSRWKEKSVSQGVRFIGRLKEAWDWVNPLLPDGSYCSSAYRSIEDQRRILQRFFNETFRIEITARYGKARYDAARVDLVKNEAQVLQMVRGVGQAVAPPGRSPHQFGKAIDLGGPDAIDPEQLRTVSLVAKAHPNLFTGRVLKERNGCVHFEIR